VKGRLRNSCAKESRLFLFVVDVIVCIYVLYIFAKRQLRFWDALRLGVKRADLKAAFKGELGEQTEDVKTFSSVNMLGMGYAKGLL